MIDADAIGDDADDTDAYGECMAYNDDAYDDDDDAGTDTDADAVEIADADGDGDGDDNADLGHVNYHEGKRDVEDDEDDNADDKTGHGDNNDDDICCP